MVMTEESVDEIEDYPEDGCYVHGFYMDGARYNREEAVIDEQAPVSISYCLFKNGQVPFPGYFDCDFNRFFVFRASCTT